MIARNSIRSSHKYVLLGLSFYFIFGDPRKQRKKTEENLKIRRQLCKVVTNIPLIIVIVGIKRNC